MRVGKHRDDGSIEQYVARCYYDFKENTYLPGYSLLKVKNFGADLMEIDYNSRPWWAKGAIEHDDRKIVQVSNPEITGPKKSRYTSAVRNFIERTQDRE
jgi:hypothetical protein